MRFAPWLSALALLLPLGSSRAVDLDLPLLPGSTSGKLLGWLLKGGAPSEVELEKELQQRVRRTEALYTDGANRAAATLSGAWLLQGHPSKLQAVLDNLRYLSAGALAAEGASSSSRKLLLEMLRRRPPSDFRPAALRKLIDLTLESGDYEGGLKPLSDFTPEAEETDELAYLKGHALAALGHAEQAGQALGSLGSHSRFRAAALYLQGILALQRGDTEAAEDFFCRIVHQPGGGRYTFFVSAHTAEVIERAWLALARLRHDRGEYARAVDTYRQLPADSTAGRLAAWETAWALYRLERHQESLLALEASGAEDAFSPLRAEAWLLRGYILVGLCEFDEATRVFERLLQFLGAPAQEGAAPDTAALVAPAPELWPAGPEREAENLRHEVLDTFGWAVYLTGQTRRLLSGLWSRWQEPAEADLAEDFEGDLSRAQGLLRRAEQLKHLLPEAEGRELENVIAQAVSIRERARAGSERVRLHRLAVGAEPLAPDASRLPVDYLSEELRGLLQIDGDTGRLLERIGPLAESARRNMALQNARQRRHFTRLARLGKIDAELGRKQSLEIEVENLALGHYPLSLYRELAASGQLGPDIEYWPYDGEGWPDEMEAE